MSVLKNFMDLKVANVRKGRGVDAEAENMKGRKPSGCGLHYFGLVSVLLGQNGHFGVSLGVV